MTAPYYSDDLVTLYHGDCRDVLATLPDASVDAVVTDPPYELGFMGKAWDASGIAYSVPMWAEVFRVLKPGGHLLSFGGTRTWHRMVCAVEDAGFEVRDCLGWLYGSGFPKSLDVSKAIDKAAGAERVVVGLAVGAGSQNTASLGPYAPTYTATAPATPDAERWQGWGTALKPAWEPICVARKPLMAPGVNVLAMVESGLREHGIKGDIQWTNGPASGAARPDRPTSSSSTAAPRAAATFADHADASEMPSDERPTGSDSATSTPHGVEPTASTSAPTPVAGQPNSGPKSSPPTATPAPAAASEPPTSSPSTTSTVAEPHTARQRGGRSTPRSSDSDSLTATESFAGIATGLTGSWATARIDMLADGTCVWPDGLPRDTAGRSTVAANVLAHGTGALNIDGCRVAGGERPHRVADYKDTDASTYAGRMDGTLQGGSKAEGVTTTGRWPANVVLDEHAAAALDEQSGPSVSRIGQPRGAGPGDGWGMTATGAEYADQGGASRFFYVAKAPTHERPKVDGKAHATVKPLTLMRWLVRLVTPPGGTVLDPFAGSGTTAEACVIEGFRCQTIEADADHLPLIVQRLSKPIEPTLFGAIS